MKLKFTLLFLLFSTVGFCQSISYYPFNSLLGLTTNTQKAVWLDLKIQTNSYFSSLGSDFATEFTIKQKPKATYYFGIGTKLNFFNLAENNSILEGYFINSGVRISPFEKYKKVNVVFELSPYAGKNFDIGVFRSNFGISYNISR